MKCLEKLIGKNTNLKKFNEKYPDPGEVEIGMKPDDYYETFAGKLFFKFLILQIELKNIEDH